MQVVDRDEALCVLLEGSNGKSGRQETVNQIPGRSSL